jgi:hypothetical protein
MHCTHSFVVVSHTRACANTPWHWLFSVQPGTHMCSGLHTIVGEPGPGFCGAQFSCVRQSTHRPSGSQYGDVFGQSPLVAHSTQRCVVVLQVSPLGQFASPKHRTQTRAAVSQYGFGFAQSPSPVQETGGVPPVPEDAPPEDAPPAPAVAPPPPAGAPPPLFAAAPPLEIEPSPRMLPSVLSPPPTPVAGPLAFAGSESPQLDVMAATKHAVTVERAKKRVMKVPPFVRP